MRKQRTPETLEERQERQKKEAQHKSDEIAVEDRAIDEMIRRNIEVHGP